MRRISRWFRNTRLWQWWLCTTKQCSYFEHYLAHGPAELTHEGYHSAERLCDHWQKRSMDWYEEHPDSLQRCPYDSICERWEKAVRA